MTLHRMCVFVACALTGLSTASLAAGAASNEATPGDNFKKAVKAIEGKDFATAETLLTAYVNKREKDASGWNYLAYAQRNQGKHDDAMRNYTMALTLDPNHKGALEYQGELFLKLGNIDAAKANLAKLEHVCAPVCDERDMLQAAIERVKDGKAAWATPDTRTEGR